MAQNLTITTFNVENLFNRYAFLDTPWDSRNYENFVQAIGLVSVAGRQGDLVSYETTAIQRNNTAQAILDAKPDLLAVQEVENLYTLRIFNDTYLDNYFDRILLIDGNDPRGIDVGLMIRKGFSGRIANIRTHVDEAIDGGSVRHGTARNFGYLAYKALFSRDCLEVDIETGKQTLTLLVNHLKAQDDSKTSAARRAKQAARVAELADDAAKAGRLPIVLGDLNVDSTRDDTLAPLVDSPLLADPFPAGTWTHFYAYNPKGKRTSRLDYILPHKSLEVTATDIVRKGLTTKCKEYDGPRYPTVGLEHTEASDHCPVSVTIKL